MEMPELIGAVSRERPLRIGRKGARLALAHLAANHPELLAMGLARARARARGAGRNTTAIDRADERHPVSASGRASADQKMAGETRAEKWMGVRLRGASAAVGEAALELRKAAWAHQDRVAADALDVADGTRPPARPETAQPLDRASKEFDRALGINAQPAGHDPGRPPEAEGAGSLLPGTAAGRREVPPPVLVEIRIPDPELVGADHARRRAQSLEETYRRMDPAEVVARHAAGREEAARGRGPAASLLAGEYARGVAIIERVAGERGIALSADRRQNAARQVAGRRQDGNEL